MDQYERLYNELLQKHARTQLAIKGAVVLLESLGGMLPGTKVIVDLAVEQLEAVTGGTQDLIANGIHHQDRDATLRAVADGQL